MTTLTYILAKITKSIGIINNKKRLSEANKNTYILKEAEHLLGELIWQDVENIQQLSPELDKITQIIKQQKEIETKIKLLEKYPEQIDSQKHEHYQQINNLNVELKTLENQKAPIYKKIGHTLCSKENLKHPQIKKIVKKHTDLIKKIVKIKKTINYNLKLVHE